MSDELREKLRSVIHKTYKHNDTTELLEDIAMDGVYQSFVDDGWRKVSPLMNFKADHQMSGAYWYDRFEKELKTQYDSFVDFVDIDMNIYNHGKVAMMLASLDAARRAADLEEKS